MTMSTVPAALALVVLALVNPPAPSQTTQQAAATAESADVKPFQSELLELGFDDDLVDDERSDEISVAAFGRDAGFPRVYASAALRVALDRTDGGILALQLGGEPHWSLILEEGWVSMVPDVWTEAPPMPRAPAQLRARDALGREVVLVPTE